MLPQNNNLIRLFGVLKTIADFGPAATADRDFAETASEVLKRTLEALDALQGALFVFDHGVVRMTVVACTGFDFLTPKAGVQLGRSQSQKWLQARGAQMIELGRTSSSPRLQIAELLANRSEKIHAHLFIDEMTKAWRGTLDW